MSKLIPRATHQNTINLDGTTFDCFVLQDGRRLLSQRSVLRAIGAAEEGGKLDRLIKNPQKNRGAKLAKTEGQNESKSADFGSPDRGAKVEFLPPHGGTPAMGREPAFLIDLCRELQRKLIAGELRQNQMHLGQRASELLGALAGVGLESMIDEACGYVPTESRQDALDRWLRRDRNFGVGRILSDEFIQNICRLHGYSYTPGTRTPKLMIGIAGNFYKHVLGEQKYAEFKAACDQDIVRTDGLRSEMFQKLTDDALGFMQSQEIVATAFAKTCPTKERFWAMFVSSIRGSALQLHFGF